MNLKNELWEFKYSPISVDEMILPSKEMSILKKYIDDGKLNNCLFYSSKPGTGKSTLTSLIRNSNKFLCTFINASRETGIDTVKYNINKFVSTVSFNNTIKVVILDEADRLSPNALDALKADIELKINSARFVFTANRESAFPDPILSRLKVFNFDKMFTENKNELYLKALERLEFILTSENVKYDKKAVALIIKKYAPDWRMCIKTCQLLSAYNNTITLEDVENIDVKNDISELVGMLKDKNFKAIREFSVKHTGNEIQIMQELFKLIKTDIITNESKPKLILILAETNRYINVVPDPEIEMMAAFIEILTSVEFNS
jgi:replication factor C subunit 3/5